MKRITAFDIDYDLDEEHNDVVLPKSISFLVEDDFDPENELADKVSEETGFCVNSCSYEYGEKFVQGLIRA